MAYQATVLKIMIASPDDVVPERSLIREILYEWNAVNSDMRKIVLLPIAWETHSSPEMGERPQAIINKGLLKNCDLLVGVFWTRIGTATDKYASGTVEEIEEHIKSGKPAMLYFSSAPVRPDSVDPDQYSKLMKFKESKKSMGLYEMYSDMNDFKSKFNRELGLKLNSEPFIKISQPSSETIISAESAIPDIPPLSREAQVLLEEASQDRNGIVMHVQYSGGAAVQTNDKNFITDDNPRTHAIWAGAVEELEKSGLIKDKGHKREVFEVTRKGYSLADLINP